MNKLSVKSIEEQVVVTKDQKIKNKFNVTLEKGNKVASIVLEGKGTIKELVSA